MLDDELRALVSVDHSPEFRARVRTRVAAGGPAAPRLGLRLAFAGATVAIAALVAGVVWFTEPPHADSVPVLLTAQQPALPAAALSAAIVPVPPQLTGSLAPAPSGRGAHMAARGLPRSRVIVDRAEALALQALFGAAGALPAMNFPEPTGDAVVIPELTIAPIVIASAEGESR